MNPLSEVAPAFVEMAHRMVWCSVASVDARGRLRVFPGCVLLGQGGQVLKWHE